MNPSWVLQGKKIFTDSEEKNTLRLLFVLFVSTMLQMCLISLHTQKLKATVFVLLQEF